MRAHFYGITILMLALIYSCTEQELVREVDIDTYDMQVKYTEAGQLNVGVIVHCRKKPGVEALNFRLNSIARIESITAQSKGKWQVMAYDREYGQLSITLPADLSKDRELSLRFEYSYPVTEDVSDFFYLDRGNRWYPLIIDDLARVKLSVTVPARFQLLSGGDLQASEQQEGQATYVWKTRMPVFKIPFVLLGQKKYSTRSLPCGDKALTFYFIQESNEQNQSIVNEASQTFQFFNRKIGDYHHNKLTFVEIDRYPGASFITTGLVLTNTKVMDQYREGYHRGLHLTTAAQWFGAGVFGQWQAPGFWFFSLSLPHYLRMMYLEAQGGAERLAATLERAYQGYLDHTDQLNDVPVFDVDMIDTEAKGHILVGKGPFIWHRVRTILGEDTWEALLRELYADLQGKALTAALFRDYLADYGGKESVAQFNQLMTVRGDIREAAK